MDLPPFDITKYDMPNLVAVGVVSRYISHKYFMDNEGLSAYDYVNSKGLVQLCWNSTELAIRQWVPLGATVADMMKASGGSCNPTLLAEAIRNRNSNGPTT